MRAILSALVVLALAHNALAKIHTETIEYVQDGTKLQGYLAYDDATDAKRPAILVVHEWWGLNDYARERTRMLAEAGFLAFAADMYGDGKTTDHPQEAGEWATQIRMNQEMGAARFNAAYDLLKKHRLAKPGDIAAIGYCFGGATVLTMAMRGADLKGVVSFHGGLPTDPATGAIKAKILVCHGAADPFSTEEQVKTFQQNLASAGADWEFISYGGAKHSFSVPTANERGIPGIEYNKAADLRSWRAMTDFFQEIFAN